MYSSIYDKYMGCNSSYRLQYWNDKFFNKSDDDIIEELQQFLPLAVLKHYLNLN